MLRTVLVWTPHPFRCVSPSLPTPQPGLQARPGPPPAAAAEAGGDGGRASAARDLPAVQRVQAGGGQLPPGGGEPGGRPAGGRPARGSLRSVRPARGGLPRRGAGGAERGGGGVRLHPLLTSLRRGARGAPARPRDTDRSGAWATPRNALPPPGGRPSSFLIRVPSAVFNFKRYDVEVCVCVCVCACARVCACIRASVWASVCFVSRLEVWRAEPTEDRGAMLPPRLATS